jgi:hypothetical protein
VIKICSTPFFGGEVKLKAPCHKILRHVKELYDNERNMSYTKSILYPDPPDLLLDGSAGRISRELWWMN